MKGILSAIALMLALVSAAAGAGAGETATRPADPTFRLLELGGRKVRWAVPANGLPATIRYAFLTAPAQFPGARNCDAMLPPDAALAPSRVSLSAFRREVRAAFSVWAQAANINFVETTSVADAGILIGADAKARGRAFTNVALRENTDGASTSGIGAIRQSLICLNPKKPWKIGFDGNLDVYDVRFTITHEIGHAIGLDHPSPAGQLMSFRYVEKTQGLQPGDIAGAVALYGRRGAAAPSVRQAAAVPRAGTRAAAQPARSRAFGLGEPAPPRDGR
ncbi:matrixin family metalloprotease [Hyphomicrobium sp.]|uniref:matrixin family metalloprotease n=1 Tax=Hyphomicrobium sp. TaxID=82 RepID=UPI0025C7167E|nr:matrixin family metalloprotease [Hyphomicrobium sp.]MCC7252517.1 matrixin family metalloprotease [Hyphomicrobium sp.]